MTKFLDGKKISEQILDKIKKKIGKNNLKLRLAIIFVGKNPLSQIFINQKEKACQKAGIDFKLFHFSSKIKAESLKKEINKIVKNRSNSGVVIQLPLPKNFLAEEFLNLIPEEKDVDVLSEKSLGKFCQGRLEIMPPTVQGILLLLKRYKIETKGKDVVVLGSGRLVGFPLAIQLLKEKATLSVLNEFSKDAPSFIKRADIVISGVGKPDLIKSNMIKKGAIVVDAGTSMKNGKLIGDVQFKGLDKKAEFVTPVPGGVGPMTVACLLENLVALAKK